VSRLIWSPRSVADLEGIREHIATGSDLYAGLVVARLVAAPDRLRQFPQVGRIVPELGEPSLRELIVRPYRLVYRLRGEVVEVVTVFHAARMFPDLGQ
jgi:plasmid stabilization system protein ParE